MADFSLEVLRQYGITGFIVVSVFCFSGWIVSKVLLFFMKRTSEQSLENIRMSERFCSSVDSLTEALNKSTFAIDSLTEAAHSMSSEMTNLATQNEIDHSKILDRISA